MSFFKSRVILLFYTGTSVFFNESLDINVC